MLGVICTAIHYSIIEVPFALMIMTAAFIGPGELVVTLAAGEGVEPSSSGSKPDVLPVTPSRKKQGVGHRGGRNRTNIARLSIECSAIELHREPDL
jgi:hypothetical protein